MKLSEYFIYLAIIVSSTYFIRALPFVYIKKKVKNRFVYSFLKYIPYTVLAAMTVPEVFYATGSKISAMVGILVAIIFAIRGKNLTVVAVAACFSAYIVEFLV